MLLVAKKWTVFPPWNNTAVAEHFATMDDVFKLEQDILSKSDQSEIFCYEIDCQLYFVKRYYQSIGLGSWLGYSRLRVETGNQQWLHKMNIPAARVVAYGEESFLLKTCRGILITKGIDNVRDLLDIANNHAHKFQDKDWRNTIITQIASITNTLHQHRFCHNDLHWRNILIQQSEHNCEPKVYLIDCPLGKRWWWPLLYYRKLKDLASLDKLAPRYLTRTQRLKFYLQYSKITKLSKQDKKMIKGVFAHKVRRLKRKRKQAL